MSAFLKSFWQYLAHERLGYRRADRPVIPNLPDDEAIRYAEITRLERLEAQVRYMDANLDLVRAGKLRGGSAS